MRLGIRGAIFGDIIDIGVERTCLKKEEIPEFCKLCPGPMAKGVGGTVTILAGLSTILGR